MSRGPLFFICLVTNNVVIPLALMSGALGLSLTLCVTLGDSLKLSESHFPHLRNQTIIPSLRVAWRLNELMNEFRMFPEAGQSKDPGSVYRCDLSHSAAIRVRTSLRTEQQERIASSQRVGNRFSALPRRIAKAKEQSGQVNEPPRSIRLMQSPPKWCFQSFMKRSPNYGPKFARVWPFLFIISFHLNGAVQKFVSLCRDRF